MSHHISILLPGEDQINHDVERAPKALPHERYLIGDSFALGSALHTNPNNQVQLCIEPVHLHATRDHLVLLPLSELTVSSDEVMILMEEANTIFGEEGMIPISNNGYAWVYAASDYQSLYTHSLAQATGRNIDWWLPKDTVVSGLAKRWRRVQNEIQMRWHIHPINEAREAQGLPRINSVWVYGIGKATDITYSPELTNATQIISDHPWMTSIAAQCGIPLLKSQTVEWEQQASDIFVWLKDIDKQWPRLVQAMFELDLEITLIDFPQGIRKRTLRAKDYRGPAWKFWHKNQPPTWEELQA
ncbi:hypothetical protein [Polynucleobacter sp. HIN7]|uniref:hypothetical protein n=1 Tax=Polynucleobacter sp. HIN7 TaxID=3047866 RepID=UPI00257463E8|nr:hypothetical protein [Polynucleobacter sp. HIN7]BEI36832.1 hypothetical protein PHIN7_05560 [Polynucleobacter sp. HIN7]